MKVLALFPTANNVFASTGTFPFAINDADAITGYDIGNNNLNHGFLRSPCDKNHADDEGCD
jgi:hypothetical protein